MTPSTSVDRAVPLAVRAGRGGQDRDLVTGRLLPAGQPVDLGLDAAQPGQVAVGQVGDPHGPILAPDWTGGAASSGRG